MRISLSHFRSSQKQFSINSNLLSIYWASVLLTTTSKMWTLPSGSWQLSGEDRWYINSVHYECLVQRNTKMNGALGRGREQSTHSGTPEMQRNPQKWAESPVQSCYSSWESIHLLISPDERSCLISSVSSLNTVTTGCARTLSRKNLNGLSKHDYQRVDNFSWTGNLQKPHFTYLPFVQGRTGCPVTSPVSNVSGGIPLTLSILFILLTK